MLEQFTRYVENELIRAGYALSSSTIALSEISGETYRLPRYRSAARSLPRNPQEETADIFPRIGNQDRSRI